MKTKWDKVPVYSFQLKNMQKPTDIATIFGDNNIVDYVYKIECTETGIVIKYGMSAECKTTRPGERVYRQVGHLESWGKKIQLYGINGMEFVVMAEDYKKLTEKELSHTTLKVTVYDFTQYPFETLNKTMEVNLAEIELIAQHEKLHGEKPLGNIGEIDEPRGFTGRRRFAPLRATFAQLFNIEDEE